MKKINFDRAWDFLQHGGRAADPSGWDSEDTADWTGIWQSLVRKAPRLLLPLAMDTFETEYDGSEGMVMLDAPDMSIVNDPLVQASSTDVRFGVKEAGDVLRRYHFAAQNTLGPNMTSYMMAYNYCDATEFAEIVDGDPVFQWPRSMVICFHGSESSPDELPMDLDYSRLDLDDDLHIPAVPILNVSSGTVEEIIDHNLLILLPFFIQRYRADLDILDADSEWLDEVVDHYRSMAGEIIAQLIDGDLSVGDATALGEAMRAGIQMTAVGHENVLRRIQDVVQNDILDALPEVLAYATPDEI